MDTSEVNSLYVLQKENYKIFYCSAIFLAKVKPSKRHNVHFYLCLKLLHNSLTLGKKTHKVKDKIAGEIPYIANDLLEKNWGGRGHWTVNYTCT